MLDVVRMAICLINNLPKLQTLFHFKSFIPLILPFLVQHTERLHSLYHQSLNNLYVFFTSSLGFSAVSIYFPLRCILIGIMQ